MNAYRSLGPLDEKLFNSSEHADLCLAVRNANQQIYLEPSSVITYLIPDRLEAIDKDYFARCAGVKPGLRPPWSDLVRNIRFRPMNSGCRKQAGGLDYIDNGCSPPIHIFEHGSVQNCIRSFGDTSANPWKRWQNLKQFSLSQYVTNRRIVSRLIPS